MDEEVHGYWVGKRWKQVASGAAGRAKLWALPGTCFVMHLCFCKSTKNKLAYYGPRCTWVCRYASVLLCGLLFQPAGSKSRQMERRNLTPLLDDHNLTRQSAPLSLTYDLPVMLVVTQSCAIFVFELFLPRRSSC